jgi:hypothetical protein
MKTRDILVVAGLGLAGYAAYRMLVPPTPPAWAGYGAQYLQPGQTYNGWYNGSGAPVWLTATGMALSLAGQALNHIPWGTIFDNNNGGGGGGNATPEDWYDEYSPGGV